MTTVAHSFQNPLRLCRLMVPAFPSLPYIARPRLRELIQAGEVVFTHSSSADDLINPTRPVDMNARARAFVRLELPATLGREYQDIHHGLYDMGPEDGAIEGVLQTHPIGGKIAAVRLTPLDRETGRCVYNYLMEVMAARPRFRELEITPHDQSLLDGYYEGASAEGQSTEWFALTARLDNDRVRVTKCEDRAQAGALAADPNVLVIELTKADNGRAVNQYLREEYLIELVPVEYGL